MVKGIPIGEDVPIVEKTPIIKYVQIIKNYLVTKTITLFFFKNLIGHLMMKLFQK